MPGASASDVEAQFSGLESEREPIIVLGTHPPDPLPAWADPVEGFAKAFSASVPSTGMLQPLFHIDLFITLVGSGKTPLCHKGRDYTVMVGDPTLGLPTDTPLPPLPPGLSFDPTRAAEFEAVATQLKNEGFHVVRNPLPLLYEDSAATFQTWYYFACYNNAVVQRNPDRVLLPTFADKHRPELEDVDNAAAARWEELGFDVVRIPDCNVLMIFGGAVDCIKNVLGRVVP